MRKQQLIVVSIGLALLISLFFFGKTVNPNKKQITDNQSNSTNSEINIQELLKHAKERLTPEQTKTVISLENSVIRGNIKDQQIKAFYNLASFWKDSVGIFEPYIYYISEASKLENSEKSLTFAAHLFLTNLKVENNSAMQHWLATNAKVLFQKAIDINPKNDSSKIGLGACYLFGNISNNPMEGINLIRNVLEKDSTNTFAQMMLAIGGLKSNQLEKAIERFLTVLRYEPNNLEAAINLAETFEKTGDKANSIKWYEFVKTNMKNKEVIAEIENRIKQLK